MKFLRNPLVVGLLGVSALALLFWNVIRPMLPQARPPAATAPPLTTPLAAAMEATDRARILAAQINSRMTATNRAVPVTNAVDREVLRRESTPWMETPRRDPFLVRPSPGSATYPGSPPARELLTLSGIWRQTSGSLAVINRLVVAEGDTLLKFTVEKIHPDHVWVRGPNGLETLEFKGAFPTPPNGTPKLAPVITPVAPEPNPRP